jgi:hypothetical protein
MATANLAVTYCQANLGATLPAQYYGFPHYGHGHSAKSVNGFIMRLTMVPTRRLAFIRL